MTLEHLSGEQIVRSDLLLLDGTERVSEARAQVVAMLVGDWLRVAVAPHGELGKHQPNHREDEPPSGREQ